MINNTESAVALPTPELSVGDVVITWGMRVRIDAITTYEDGVTSAAGTVLNVETVDKDDLVPRSWRGPNGDKWNIQGNALAYWRVVTR